MEKVIIECGFARWSDIKLARLRDWLADQRAADQFGIKTSNHYLANFKEFCNWVVRDGHTPTNPVAFLQPLNPDTDIRRQRRALSADEFAALVAAAEGGPPDQKVTGPDRAMLYILAAWTGYRRKELASLTKPSFRLNSKPPTVTVAAAYSKRRRNDVIPLHAEVAKRLKAWLSTKDSLRTNEPVFNLTAPGGDLRRTSKMMKLDLERAREAWIDEAKTKKEMKKREESDYLQ